MGRRLSEVVLARDPDESKHDDQFQEGFYRVSLAHQEVFSSDS